MQIVRLAGDTFLVKVVAAVRRPVVRVRHGLEDVERIVAKRRLPDKGVNDLRGNWGIWFGLHNPKP